MNANSTSCCVQWCSAPLLGLLCTLGCRIRWPWNWWSVRLVAVLAAPGCDARYIWLRCSGGARCSSPGEGCPLPWYSEPLALVFLAFGDCCALCFFCMLCLMHLVLTGGALAMLLGASGCDVWFPCLWRLVFLVVVLSVLCCGGRSPWLWRSVASPVGLGGLGPCLRRWVFFGCGPQCFWARCLAF